MLDQLLRLPNLHIWLPIVAAALFGLPLLWMLLRRSPTDADAQAKSSADPLPDPFLPKENSADKRKAARRQGNVIKLLCAVVTTPDDHFNGYVVDRSVTGLRLLLPGAYPIGAVLLVRPANIPPTTPWVQVEVRSCVPSTIQADEFEVGCQFVRSPSYLTLSMFG
jgi:hypothetical protein